MTQDQRKDSYSHHRLDVPTEGYEKWVDITVLIQHYGERLSLVSVEWREYTQADGKRFRGPDGASYWMPATPATKFLSARPGHVYARHGDGMNGYGIDFETADTFTACDLLNLAAAEYDGAHWPHLPTQEIGESGDTNPFRTYVH